MQSNRSRSISRTLVYEGGKVDNPHDPGGRTNEGVTQSTFNAYLRGKGRVFRDVYTITPLEVADIYTVHYWNAIKGDQLPSGLDFCVYDAAVNSGPGRAGMWLQQALGTAYHGPYDGMIGLKTFQAITDFNNEDGLIEAFCSRRLGTLQKLSTWPRFGKGWHARIANVQKAAIAMEGTEDVPMPVDVSSIGGHQKAPVNIPPSKISQGLTHATTMATGTGAMASTTATQLQPLQAAFPHWHWLAVLLGILAGTSAVTGAAVSVSDSVKKQAQAGTRQAMVDIDADQGLPTIDVGEA